MYYFEITSEKLSRILQLARKNPECTADDCIGIQNAEVLLQNIAPKTSMSIVDLNQIPAWDLWGEDTVRDSIESGEFNEYLADCSDETLENIIRQSMDEIDWKKVSGCNFNYDNPVSDGIEVVLKRMGLMPET